MPLIARYRFGHLVCFFVLGACLVAHRVCLLLVVLERIRDCFLIFRGFVEGFDLLH